MAFCIFISFFGERRSFNMTANEMFTEKFNEYNKLYFNGELGKCRFYFLGKECGLLGKYLYYDDNGKNESRIGIKRNIDDFDVKLKSTLIHEMVHMYVTTIEGVKHDGLFGHGRRFRKHNRRLKKEFGILI